ncbi:MAG TPA: STAS domain-containing protein [Dissulfurispiraceae bacterium]|nr:STAS domain-containing protein [Dissulfurispiraceae bacterium]
MAASDFSVSLKKVGDAAVVYPQGYLNNVAGESLVQECVTCIEGGTRKIVLNFKRTDLINSIGISMLLSIIEKLLNTGGQLCFTNMNPMLKETFEMLGLSKYISIFDDENDALTYLHMAERS